MAQEFTIEEQGEGERLDLYLSHTLSAHFSRSQIQKMIKTGRISLAGVPKVAAH